jgi:hypothetical protein
MMAGKCVNLPNSALAGQSGGTAGPAAGAIGAATSAGAAAGAALGSVPAAALPSGTNLPNLGGNATTVH